ncbi:MAG: formylglycine-generating enzyme family protein [Anaerolineaceae bacterium]|nr:formylglycine-generating enzyme family protein [Anaerolineaceae bacterium]
MSSYKIDRRIKKRDLRTVFMLFAVMALGLGASACQPVETPVEEETPDLAPTATWAPIRTNTPTATSVPTITLTSGLGVGSTQVSGQDGMIQAYVPAGEFEMGSLDEEGDEQPLHVVYLDAFWIDQTEVTNVMFANFLNEMGNQVEGGATWLDAIKWAALIEYQGGVWKPKEDMENYPVVEVTWYGAHAYCEWAERRLPTEAEWEKAARGTDGRTYPWGEGIECIHAQFGSCGGGLLPVGILPGGASPYDALDMGGNVWEFVSDTYLYHYYETSPHENPWYIESGDGKVRRGGAYDSDVSDVRAARRGSFWPGESSPTIGFRCVLSAAP